jgi:hypothetical protein
MGQEVYLFGGGEPREKQFSEPFQGIWSVVAESRHITPGRW